MRKPRLTMPDMARVAEARVYVMTKSKSFPIVVHHYASDRDAYQVYLGLRKGTRAAFRGANDATPVYSHDYVDVV